MEIDFKSHNDFVARLRRGQVTADEIRERIAATVAEEGAALKKSLAQLTVDQLQRLVIRRGKKAELVNMLYRGLLGQLVAPASNGMVSWIPAQESYEGAIQRQAEAMTDAQIAEYSAKTQAVVAERMRSLTAPESLEEFETFLRVRGEADLSDAQIARYDSLCLAKAQADRAAQAERAAHVEALDEEITLVMRDGWHSKKECAIWVVRPVGERLPTPIFRQLADKADRWSARWSTWGPAGDHGFIFWDKADAEAFMGLAGGQDATLTDRWQRREAEKKTRAADRLSAYAGRAEGRAQASLLRDRLVNTIRRVRMAESSWASAREEQRIADTCEAVAGALARDELTALARLRHVSQVVTLMQLLDAAVLTAVRAAANGRYINEDERRRLPAPSDIRHVAFPWPFLYPDSARLIVAALKGTRGDRKTNRLYLEEMIADADSGYIQAHRAASADALVSLSAEFPATYFGRIEEWKRLRAMGLDSLPLLRAGLRELLPFLGVTAAPDPIRQAELDLVGLRIPGFFPTPAHVVDEMLAWAEIKPDQRILEPSAGNGNIADALAAEHPDAWLEVVEINSRLCAILEMKDHRLVGYDLPNYVVDSGRRYDRIIGNPPFERGQDWAHLWHCYYRLLAPGGRLVFIVANGAAYRQNRELAESYGLVYDEELPAGTFAEAGTGVSSRLIVMDRSVESG